MISKKTYIPAKPRNKKLTTSATGESFFGKSEFNGVIGSSHEHNNKEVLDSITEETLLSASREMITSTDEETELTDENILSSLRVLAEILKNNVYLKTQFLSKLEPDTAQKLIQFIEGITVGEFTSGLLGAGAAISNIGGTTVAEVDQLLVRQRAEFFSVLIHHSESIGGQLIISAANMLCIKVEEYSDFYRCYFDAKDGEVINLFENTDFARSQIFTGTRQKFYWRKVIAVGSDYIELSKTDAAINSDVPEAGDSIFQLGSTDVNRQAAFIISTVGADAPSWIQYNGINSYSLEGKEYTKFTRLGNVIRGDTVFLSDGTNFEAWVTGTESDIEAAQAAANAAQAAAEAAAEDAAANVALINSVQDDLQAQIDGEISNWFYPYVPTLTNYPASEWTTDAEKSRHVGDTFTNTEQIPSANAGKSWRFVNNSGVYSWTPIADSDAVLAYQLAAQAQSTADGKSTTYLIQPTSYKFGDIWILNADQTVGGVAYKQGDMLTVTQDSASFVGSHWVKKIRYTDDTAVNNLQIGGRNYWLNSISYTPSTWGGGQSYGSRDLSSLIADGTEMTIQFDVETNIAWNLIIYKSSTQSIIWGTSQFSQISSVNLIAGKQTVKATFTYDSAKPYIVIYDNTGSSQTVTFTYVTLCIGNKASWSEAPEDVQAKIDTAKQEALTAAGNAQTSANTANTAISNLDTYVDGAFHDGVIEESEAKAIEKYINIVNTEKSNLEATYNTLYANTYLEGTPKTNLLNAKITYFGAVDTLINSINAAIANGKTTVAEKQDVDTKYASYKTALASLQTAIENANKAIQNKLDSLSTDKVNNLQIGGINLCNNSKFGNIGAIGNFEVENVVDKFGDATRFKRLAGNGGYQTSHSTTVKSGQNVTISVKVKPVSGVWGIGWSSGSYTYNFVNYTSPYLDLGDGWRLYYQTRFFDYTITGIFGLNTVNGEITICDLMVEYGNKPSSYSKSPEDVQAQIDLSSDGYMRARYIRDWAKGNTVNTSNGWGEIKVFNKAGTNLALNKIPTSNGTFNTLTPAINLTDNDITTYAAFNGTTPATKNYVQIDLGAIYYDIDYIQVWHYYTDGRTYYETKTEISVDGTNWTAIFDSSISGTYKETAAGNVLSLHPNQILAKVLRGAAITDQYGFIVNGGLISPVITEYREVGTLTVTAGSSGIQGASSEKPAFWAGGTYDEAIAGTAKAIIRHDGTSKFADTEITGTIHATSGDLGSLTLAEGGYIDLPPSFASDIKGRIDESGLNLIYDGTNSQSVSWYTKLGTFVGNIKSGSDGYLNIFSNIGIKIQTENTILISSNTQDGIINIEQSIATVQFGGAILDNIKKITGLGFPVFAYTTLAMSANTNHTIGEDVALLVITSAYSDSGILKITLANNVTPSYGMIKIIINISTEDIRLKCTTAGSNIRYENPNQEYVIHSKSSAILVYYGYWIPLVDRGQ